MNNKEKLESLIEKYNKNVDVPVSYYIIDKGQYYYVRIGKSYSSNHGSFISGGKEDFIWKDTPLDIVTVDKAYAFCIRYIDYLFKYPEIETEFINYLKDRRK